METQASHTRSGIKLPSEVSTLAATVIAQIVSVAFQLGMRIRAAIMTQLLFRAYRLQDGQAHVQNFEIVSHRLGWWIALTRSSLRNLKRSFAENVKIPTTQGSILNLQSHKSVWSLR